MKRSIKRRKGQGLTEYVVIVGLIAILLIGAVTKFKDALQNSYDKASAKIESDIAAKIDGGSGGADGPPAAAAAATGAAGGAVDGN